MVEMEHIAKIRISKDLWNAAKTQAHSEGVGVSELVRNWLEDYVADAAPVGTELSRIIRRLAEIHKRLHHISPAGSPVNGSPVHGGFVWPNTDQ